MNVYKCISLVANSLCEVGIAKTGFNKDQNYQFRGIDSFLDTLSPLLVKHGLIIVPRYDIPTLSECGKTTKGNAIMYAMVRGEFDLIAVEDGSKHTAICFGEGKDSGDKAISKAMSTAFKYMAAQTFCIPFSGMQDVEGFAETNEGAMPQARKDELLAKIGNSGTLEALRQEWTAATQEAQSLSDPSAFKDFTSAKDARKTELSK